jgi:site-specific DNA-methyltransferase (adenine-specific)
MGQSAAYRVSIVLHDGDCLIVLPTLAENSLDACVTDPPYHLTSIVKRFGGNGAAPAQYGSDGRYARASAGFMGKQWDGGDIAFRPEVWREVRRVLKPGAHLLAFGGTRTYHRMACAIEDAGFEIRDCIQWLYGQGFPKSHSVGNGWGTALKPACEMIVLARKPLSEGTVAGNVLRWGTGSINVDGCRVDGPMDGVWGTSNATCAPTFNGSPTKHEYRSAPHQAGRWPANLIHDGSEEVVAGFPSNASVPHAGAQLSGDGTHEGWKREAHKKDYPKWVPYEDEGSVSRYFYTAKADSDDRLGSKHPTVKPLDLMQYLVRLVTPKGGSVLDPFAGTGSTGEAAFREGMRAVLIEREAEYQADIRRRMKLVLAGPDERAYAGAKERMKDKPRDDGPLFDRVL